jgi:hypothetical protein
MFFYPYPYHYIYPSHVWLNHTHMNTKNVDFGVVVVVFGRKE